jgi:hypothetical protein
MTPEKDNVGTPKTEGGTKKEKDMVAPRKPYVRPVFLAVEKERVAESQGANMTDVFVEEMGATSKLLSPGSRNKMSDSRKWKRSLRCLLSARYASRKRKACASLAATSFVQLAPPC